MKKVFYIEKEKFLRLMVDELFKKSEAWDSYTVDGQSDYFYLIDDLSPSHILVDWETVKKEGLDFLMAYMKNLGSQIPVIVTFKKQFKEEIPSYINHLLPKPINPLQLESALEKVI